MKYYGEMAKVVKMVKTLLDHGYGVNEIQLLTSKPYVFTLEEGQIHIMEDNEGSF